MIGTVQFKIPDDPSLRDQIEQIKGKRYESNEALHDVRTLEGLAGIQSRGLGFFGPVRGEDVWGLRALPRTFGRVFGKQLLRSDAFGCLCP